jgi:hypothetical protein
MASNVFNVSYCNYKKNGGDTPDVASHRYVIREAAVEHSLILYDVMIDLYIFN